MSQKFLSVRETAGRLGIRLLTVYSLLWDRSILGEKQDGVWKVDAKSVEAYSRRRRTRAHAIRDADAAEISA